MNHFSTSPPLHFSRIIIFCALYFVYAFICNSGGGSNCIAQYRQWNSSRRRRNKVCMLIFFVFCLARCFCLPFYAYVLLLLLNAFGCCRSREKSMIVGLFAWRNLMEFPLSFFIIIIIFLFIRFFLTLRSASIQHLQLNLVNWHTQRDLKEMLKIIFLLLLSSLSLLCFFFYFTEVAIEKSLFVFIVGGKHKARIECNGREMVEIMCVWVPCSMLERVQE